MVLGIDNLEKETNISTQNGKNKTKAEILYDLTLAIISSGQGIHDNAIRYAHTTYASLLRSGIIYELEDREDRK